MQQPTEWDGHGPSSEERPEATRLAGLRNCDEEGCKANSGYQRHPEQPSTEPRRRPLARDRDDGEDRQQHAAACEHRQRTPRCEVNDDRDRRSRGGGDGRHNGHGPFGE